MRSVSLASLAATPLYLHLPERQRHDRERLRRGGDARVQRRRSRVVRRPNGATGGTSAHEAQNPNPNGGSADSVFVSRGPPTFRDTNSTTS